MAPLRSTWQCPKQICQLKKVRVKRNIPRKFVVLKPINQRHKATRMFNNILHTDTADRFLAAHSNDMCSSQTISAPRKSPSSR